MFWILFCALFGAFLLVGFSLTNKKEYIKSFTIFVFIVALCWITAFIEGL